MAYTFAIKRIIDKEEEFSVFEFVVLVKMSLLFCLTGNTLSQLYA